MKYLFIAFFAFVSFSTISGQKKNNKKAVTQKKVKQAPDADVVSAIELFQTGDYKKIKEALVKFEDLLEQYPNDGQVLANLSIVYAHLSYRDWHFGTKDMDYLNAAQTFADKALKLKSGGEAAHRAKANVLLILGKRAEARKEIEKVIKTANDPNEWYLYACASDGSIIDEGTDAGKRMKKAIDLGYLFAHQDTIMAYLMVNNTSSANNILTRMKEKFPGHSDTDFYEGMVQLKAGKTEEARATLSRYVQKNQTSNLTEYIKIYLNR